jgi:hypothetical protein
VTDTKTLPDELARVVAEAFGGATCSDVETLGGGLSGAATYGVTIAGTRYVVRRGSGVDAKAIRCLKMASERGVAPKLRHADIATGATILERIDGAPVRPGSARPGSIAATATALRRLHDGPSFPRSVDLDEVLGNVVGAIRSKGHAGLPPDLLAALAETTGLTRAVAVRAPCHNDLNPGNMVERDGRVYFLDWDTAANNDPYFDLGEVCVFGLQARGDRGIFLAEYLGRAPTEREAAHATIAWIMALGFYSAAFFMVSALTGSFSLEATALPMLELLAGMGRGAAPPPTVAASLFAAMREQMAGAEYDAAKRVLT